MSGNSPDNLNSAVFLDDSILNGYRAQLDHSSDEVQPVSIPTSLGSSEKKRQEFLDTLRESYEKARVNTNINVERIVPLDHELSKNFFTMIFDSTPLSSAMPCTFDPGLIFPILHSYKEWEDLAILIGRLFNRILDLDGLKELCGWMILISGWILSPKYESPSKLKSQEIMDRLMPLYQKVVSYSSAQFLANDVTCFVTYFGQRFFDQMFGIIDYRIFAGSFSEYRFHSAINYMTNMAVLLTTGCVERTSTTSEEEFRKECLTLFFTKYSCFILPRILFNKYFAAYEKRIMNFIEPFVSSIGVMEDYVGKNLAFIFDYFMLNRKTITEDKLTSAIYHFTGHALDHYVKRNTFQSILVCIFHMGTAKDVSLTMLKRIARAKYVEWNDLVRHQFLGLMIDLRQDLIEQPYFGERKKIIAQGLTEFVRVVSAYTLNTHVAKICHTLWILNSPTENFAEVWKVLITKLELKYLIQMRYKLLFYFLQIDDFKHLAEIYLKELERRTITNKYDQEAIDIKLLYSAIFHVPKKTSMTPAVTEIALSAMEHTVHLTPFILPTISRQLLIDYSDYNSKAKLLDRIFELSRQANTILELSTLATFVGRITAIDPKALMDTPTWKDDKPQTHMALVMDDAGLVKKFVHDIFRWHIESPSGGQSDMAALALQYICTELKHAGSKFYKIREGLPELGPYETATITANNITGYYMVPISRASYKDQIKNHSIWLVQWYRTLSKEIKMVPFVILDSLSKSHSGEEMPFIYADFLPAVVFQCLMEFDKKKVEEYLVKEAQSVFAAVSKDSPARREDISDSCQTIFQLFDDLYRIIARDARSKKIKKEIRINMLHFIEESLKYRVNPDDIMPASVQAAESCDNFYRAQRLLEQYSIYKDHRGQPCYDRSIYDLVQSLNFNLQEVENNEGAFAMILKNDKPTDLQIIKCAYAKGDYHEILPMISGENREFMVQFLHMFNQPEVVISYIAQRFSPEERRLLKRDYPDVYQVQCQAAIELQRWDLVDVELDQEEELIPKVDTMVDLSDIRRSEGPNSEDIRIEEDVNSSETAGTSQNEEDILVFISDVESDGEENQGERETFVGNGDHIRGKENVPRTDRKRPAESVLEGATKRSRLSSIPNDSALNPDDTNLVFDAKLNSAVFLDEDTNIAPHVDDSIILEDVVAPEKAVKKKDIQVLEDPRIPGPDCSFTNDLDRWDLLAKYRKDSVLDNAKRWYPDLEDSMEVLEPLTKWTPYADYDPIYEPTEQHTFIADLTLILQKCRTKRFEEAKKHLNLAQVYLMKTLGQQGVDNTRPYSVGYEFVQSLHTLEDLKHAWPQLSDRSMENIWRRNDPNETQDSIMEISQSNLQGAEVAQRSVKELLETWTARDLLIRHTPSDLEPILRNRRNILRSLLRPPNEIKHGLTKLLVQSSKLARENDMTHTVLPFLTEAKKDGCNMLELEIERAYYYMEKKDSSKNPVQIMARAVSDYFPACWTLLQHKTEEENSVFKRPHKAKTLADLNGKEDIKRWEESMITMLDMISTEQISGSSKLLKLCKNLESIGATTELFFYRYTMFVDSAFEVPHDQAARLIIRLCIETMKRGETFQYEIMPRMVTAWLDSNRELARHKKHENDKISPPSTASVEAEKNFFITTPDPPYILVKKAFNQLLKKKFYLVFSLLATRLSKADKHDAEVVKEIMSSLLNEYPHQCALLSMGEARCSTKKFGDRAEAMKQVFEEAKLRDKRMKPMIDMYRFLADNLAKISSIKINADTLDLRKNFAEFTNFVHTGHRRISTGQKRNVTKPAIPMFFKYLDQPFREIPRDAVLIHEVVNDCHVINSLARPKRLTLIGSDGEKYVILCKPTDELRKDMRFLELASMLNRRMQTSRYTKNRDYRIRTYHVVPLEETGGIIEWIPHMDTFNNCIQNGRCNNREALAKLREKVGKGRLSKEELYRIYMDKLTPLFYAEMGNYLRKTALNPSAYYQKQRNYTVTTAAMSALGHIVGLGDRHLGNILVDATNGDVMHVDFNLLFNSGEMLTVPEIVPFRLTRNIVDGFGPTGVEGRFRRAFERIIKFLQAEKPAILRLLKSFIYDPLIDWRIDDENDHASYTRRSNHSNISVQDRIELVRDRLDGYLHTTIQPKIGPITDERVLVSKLMEMAMDEESLSRMYFGWSPFV